MRKVLAFWPTDDAFNRVSIPQQGANVMVKLIKKFVAGQSGATAIEYAFISLLIALVIVASLTVVGSKLQMPFNEAANNLK